MKELREQEYCVTLEDITQAFQRIQPHVYTTPLMTSSIMNSKTPFEMSFKCESYQRSGSFKFRGAVNSVVSVLERCKKKGQPVPHFTTHSSGNQGQALSYAARRLNVSATVVVPEDAPAVKKAAIANYGAEIITCPREKRVETCQKVVETKNATLIHSYDEPMMVAGHASVAIELLRQCGALREDQEIVPENVDPEKVFDTVVVPVGGGGLTSAVALTMKYLSPKTRVIAAEPENANDAFRSKAAGERLIHETKPHSIADGLLTTLGDNTWPVVRDVVAEVCTVSEAEIKEAMLLVWTRMKVVVEPSGATPVAACLAERYAETITGDVKGRKPRVAVVMSGGNVDIAAVLAK